MSGAENGAERLENRVERGWSAEREVAERERNRERDEFRATVNSRFENAKIPPGEEKIPENSRSVKCLILHAVTQ